MNQARRLLVVAALWCGISVTHAASGGCGIDAQAIIRQAYPTAKATDKGTYTVSNATITLPAGDDIDSDPHALTCRNWPAHPGSTLVAVPLMTKAVDGENEGDLELLVIDSASQKVQQRLKLPGRMADDAVQIRRVALDTAHYQLAPGQTAFGLRLSLEGSSRVDPFGEVDLWLYTVDHGKLVPVVDGIVTDRSGGEWDGNCAGDFDGARRTLAMDRATQNGYADIVVTETASSSTSTVDKDGQCNEKDHPVKKRDYRLSYDGKSYPVPKDLKPLQ
jgi:hypothetical protein